MNLPAEQCGHVFVYRAERWDDDDDDDDDDDVFVVVDDDHGSWMMDHG